jgi:HAE1 family hydrophobic/amphiphilic exporter-1
VSLPRFGVKNPIPVNLLMAGLLLTGIYSALALQREFFPEMDPDEVMVFLPLPGASPTEIEETLVMKAEDVIADLPEVDEITTTINEGSGSIQVTFREGVSDYDKAIDEVERAIESLQDLPDEAQRLRVLESQPRMPVIMVSLRGEVQERVLKEGIRSIRDDLKALPGMGELMVSGIRTYEVSVEIDQASLVEHGLSLLQISNSVSSWLADVPGGTVRNSGGTIGIRTLGIPERIADIEDIVVSATTDGNVVTIGDIGSVSMDFESRPRLVRFMAEPAATIIVSRVGRQDIVEMAELVRAYVDGHNGVDVQSTIVQRLKGTPIEEAWKAGRDADPLPVGTTLARHSDLAVFIEGRIELLSRNAFYGAVLVFLTLLVFLNWRAAFWVAIGLMTALAGTMLAMLLLGITLNFLTMFGLIVVIGLLVDDAIVVTENIQAEADRGVEADEAAIGGTLSVMWPVLATILTSIVAFLPLAFIRGRIGDLMGALPLVVACALMMSLIECLLILPEHMAGSMRRSRKRRSPSAMSRFYLARDRVIFQIVVPWYGRVLRRLIHRRYLTLSVFVGVLTISIGMVAGGRLGYVFLPDSDAETIVVEMEMPVGTALQRTDLAAVAIEQIALDHEDVIQVTTYVGLLADVERGGADSLATHVAQFFVQLTPAETRDVNAHDVVDDLRSLTDGVSGPERLSFRMMSGGPGSADLTIRLMSEDEAQIDELSHRVRQDLESYDAVTDVRENISVGQRELQIELRAGAATLGLTVADVAGQVRAALYGDKAHVFSRENEDIDVRVRATGGQSVDLATVESLWITTPNGMSVPLGEVAAMSDGESHATIRRFNRQRFVTINAEFASGTSPEFITASLPIDQWRQQWPDVQIEFGGRQEQQSEAFASLPLGFLVACIMIYTILAWLFGSYMLPLTVMLGIPFSLVGVIWGHWLLDYEMTFLSAIGFVALSGIVVNDSLILVDFYKHLREEGEELIEAMVHAGMRRLRPIFLTTVTTVLGLTPLMLEQSFQAKFLVPMAIAISFGLISATFLILLLLPCLVVIFDDIGRGTRFLWFGRWPEQVATTEASP